jgi:membrane associated rhomboid family serine protease
MGNVYRFPGGELPPDFETKMPKDIEVRHCYRHPDRKTGVSCSNCGRPICHECMIPAAVGFRCPECIKEQGGSRAKVITRAQTRSRWSAGAMGGSAGLSVTKILVVLNVIMFVIEIVMGATSLSFFGGGSGQAMVNVGGLYVPLVLIKHEYWRMFSSMFLHEGILHLAFNMWALWVIGGFMEVAIGRLKFVILYFVSGFAGSVLILLAAPVNSLVVGASGAIFGLFGALAVHAFLNRGRDFQSQSLLRNVLFLIVINLVFTFTAGAVSWQAHIGGLVGGAVTMAAMMLAGRKDPRRPFELPDGVSVLAIVLVLVALTAWRVLTFTG